MVSWYSTKCYIVYVCMYFIFRKICFVIITFYSSHFVRTYAEEEIAKQFPTEREWVYNFANASMMTENGTFLRTQNYTPLETFFFSRKQYFYILQLLYSYRCIWRAYKSNFRIIILTGCLSHLLGPVSDKNYTPSWKLFFSVGNQNFLFHNFNTSTNGGIKNLIFE
jgi:hypothetical protein